VIQLKVNKHKNNILLLFFGPTIRIFIKENQGKRTSNYKIVCWDV